MKFWPVFRRDLKFQVVRRRELNIVQSKEGRNDARPTKSFVQKQATRTPGDFAQIRCWRSSAKLAAAPEN
jgi:hypothetical protein